MALIEKLNAIGDAIRAKTGGSEKLTLEQMPDEIASITTGGSGGIEPIVLTGDCKNAFNNNSCWNNYVDSITTQGITSAEQMFNSSRLQTIPFDINFVSDNDVSCYNMFRASLLRVAPKITGAMGRSSYLFYGCNYLKEIPEGEFANNRANSSDPVQTNTMFSSCYSLREIPASYLNNIYPQSSSGYCMYFQGFSDCYALNKIENLPVYTEPIWISNAFSNTFNACYRLNRITFATQEDGSPYVAKWKNQTIDLTSQVGRVGGGAESYILNYNSGITNDKKVNSDVTYQTLKNDPDWYTMEESWCRYNHISAVETINSLPDTSAYIASKGGTNTIKFKGAAGSATDGGAINTLTAAEIAVATTKGWTVSFA